jgi:methionyl-tRNA formyltransferase
VLQLPSLKTPEAEQALRDMEVDLAVMAYVLQFAPQSREESVTVTVQGGSVDLLKVRVEGGEKLSAAAFCAAFGLVAGSRLSIAVPATAVPAPALAPAREPPRQPAHNAKETEPA